MQGSSYDDDDDDDVLNHSGGLGWTSMLICRVGIKSTTCDLPFTNKKFKLHKN